MARRISVRKIIQTLVTLVAVTGCGLAMISADKRQGARLVRDVQLRVEHTGGVHFLTDEEVYDKLFTARHISPKTLSLAMLDVRSMEAILKSNPWVRDAQVWADAERVLHIAVTQRVPQVRLFAEDGTSYYLDGALQTMPLSPRYAHYTPIVTGVPPLSNDSAATVLKGTILGFVKKIAGDTFWAAQTTQINIRADGGFEIIPVLGTQRIILGDTARLVEKLGALFAFYKQVHNKVGWDKYRVLDLRYSGQVVASPALPWKAPVDKALSNMNWVKAIMENAPARQSQLGGDASAYADSVAPAANAMPGPTPTADTQRRAAPSSRSIAMPASPASRLPKPAPKPAPRKPAATTPNQPTRHPQNTSQHAAPKR